MKRLVMLGVAACGLLQPLHAAKVVSVTGAPEVLVNAGGTWHAATATGGMKVASASRVRCDAGSTASIVTENGHKLKIFPGSEVALSAVDGNATTVQVITGRLRSWVKKLKKHGKFEVKTPVAVCSVRGTDFSVEYGADKKARVEVYEGMVAAREERTGAEVFVTPGTGVTITQNQAPEKPQPLPENTGGPSDARLPAVINESKEEARAEIFQELNREAVLARSAEEIKLAEYQNGKALVDASGSRVRLEEYIVRTQPNEFKYVVLNTRPDRFDFGKIIFTFNDTLPDDLTLATRTMFHADSPTRPQWWLTDVTSVMSNTIDQVNEDAHGGRMFADNPSNPRGWTLGFNTYAFSVNNKTWWSYADTNVNGTVDGGELSYFNIATGNKLSFTTDFSYDAAAGKYYYEDAAGEKVYFNEFSQPGGNDTFHFYQRNNYADGQWISAEDYIIDDNGHVVGLSDLTNLSSESLKQKAYESNFERVYACSVFEGRTIDLVFSAKLLMDAGMLSMPDLSH